MKRKKPSDPAKIAAQRAQARAQAFEAVNLPADSATLPANEDIHVTREGERSRGKIAGENQARRGDVFDALREGMEAGAYDAARRLERDIIISRGEHDHGRPQARVDGAVQSAKDRTDTMIDAGIRVRKVLARVGDRDAWLLTELIAPSNAAKMFSSGKGEAQPLWRTIVTFVTGETHSHAQGAAVRAACANLSAAYHKIWRIAA